MESQFKIRKLTRKDRRVLSEILKKSAGLLSDKKLLSMISSHATVSNIDDNETIDTSIIELGIEIIKQLLDVCNDDLSVWFASLLNVTIEEFDNMPFDIEIDIINQLSEAEEFGNFFTGLSQLSKQIKSFLPR